jgi:hypothetical protein
VNPPPKPSNGPYLDALLEGSNLNLERIRRRAERILSAEREATDEATRRLERCAADLEARETAPTRPFRNAAE